MPGLSQETKDLQRERNFAQKMATLTSHPDDWRHFRSLRNRETASLRKDKVKWEEQKFCSIENSSADILQSLKGGLVGILGAPYTVVS